LSLLLYVHLDVVVTANDRPWNLRDVGDISANAVFSLFLACRDVPPPPPVVSHTPSTTPALVEDTLDSFFCSAKTTGAATKQVLVKPEWVFPASSLLSNVNEDVDNVKDFNGAFDSVDDSTFKISTLMNACKAASSSSPLRSTKAPTLTGPF